MGNWSGWLFLLIIIVIWLIWTGEHYTPDF